MSRNLILAAVIVAGLGLATGAFAQAAHAPSSPGTTPTQRPHNAASETGRDVDQQQRIEQGLQSGQLNTREAGRLEHGQQVIDKTQQRALANGSLSASERARIQKEQNAESQAIHGQKHDAQTGNPASRSSSRMQADMRRNQIQQQRIHNGVASGSLTHREAGNMEGRQARSDRQVAHAARNGRVGRDEQGHVQRTDNRDSRSIHHAKHDRQRRH